MQKVTFVWFGSSVYFPLGALCGLLETSAIAEPARRHANAAIIGKRGNRMVILSSWRDVVQVCCDIYPRMVDKSTPPKDMI